MNLDKINSIAHALLYEGFMLYPYRRSSIKNQQRWTFGGLYPKAYAARGGGDAASQQVQCLLEGSEASLLEVRMRCLQLVDRDVGLSPPDEELPFIKLDHLDVGPVRHVAWQEAIEREVVLREITLAELLRAPVAEEFTFSSRRECEAIRGLDGEPAGFFLRTRQALQGRVTRRAERLSGNRYRITVITENLTAFDADSRESRDGASRFSFASTHVVLGVQGGQFFSLIDPPAELGPAAEACENIGCFPVLVGEGKNRDLLLASPIILYDYPQIAAESPGELFDGTEIDEILSLRVLTMTEEEKREMRATDPRAAALLQRVEALGAQDLQRLHGSVRSLRPAAPRPALLPTHAPALAVGTRVRLKPKAGGDIIDLALAGRTALIESIERDFEDRVHVAVTIEDDPGRDFGAARMPGHRFFFSPQEIEALGL